MSHAPPPPRVGHILGEQTTEHNARLSSVAEDLLNLFKQEFAAQIRVGQQPRFYTVLHWCRAALGADCSIHQLWKARRALRRGGYITLDPRGVRSWSWAGGVVRPGPRLAEEIRELAAGAEEGGAA